VYLETTIVSYLTGRPNRDIRIRAHQQATRRWWRTRRMDFRTFVSPLVWDEAAAGDAAAARRRLRLLRGVPVLAISDPVKRLAAYLLQRGAVPDIAEVDAAHIALAAVHGMEYLLTWNCKHIANAAKRDEIEEACSQLGFRSAIICTPEELLED
jgi:predicted nucleic acid-binding protein